MLLFCFVGQVPPSLTAFARRAAIGKLRGAQPKAEGADTVAKRSAPTSMPYVNGQLPELDTPAVL